MKNKEIVILKLYNYLKSWQNKEGGFNSYIVHRTNAKRIFKIHDTPWTQAPMIQSFINLYKQTSNEKWLQELILSADLQAKRLNENGVYCYAGHEDERYKSLVHCALANSALLEASKFVNQKKSCFYIDTVKKNINLYLIKELWMEKKGAFKFSKIDYQSPNKNRFVANMNSIAIENLLKLYSLSNCKKYLKYALKVGEWVLTQQVKSHDIANGGINYQEIEDKKKEKNVISIYSALTSRGIIALYKTTRKKRFRVFLINLVQHLLNFRDSNSGFFYHTYKKDRLEKYPQFIAGSGIILNALYEINNCLSLDQEINLKKTENILIAQQRKNGSFPNFLGHSQNKKKYYKKKDRNWIDLSSTPNWSAHLFKYLTKRYGKKVEKINNENFSNFYLHISLKEIIFENESIFFLSSFFPIKHSIFLFAIKKFYYTIGIQFINFYKILNCFRLIF